MEIVISIICSIIASIIVSSLSKLFSYGAKDTILKKLYYLRSCISLYGNAAFNRDYSTVLSMTNIIEQYIISIYSDIYPMTFIPVKRKLVKTCLFYIYHFITTSKEYELHNNDRYYNIDRQCNNIEISLYSNTKEYAPSNIMSVILFMISLVKYRSINGGFKDYYKFGKNTNDIGEILKEVMINTSNPWGYDIISFEELEVLIKRYVKDN